MPYSMLSSRKGSASTILRRLPSRELHHPKERPSLGVLFLERPMSASASTPRTRLNPTSSPPPCSSPNAGWLRPTKSHCHQTRTKNTNPLFSRSPSAATAASGRIWRGRRCGWFWHTWFIGSIPRWPTRFAGVSRRVIYLEEEGVYGTVDAPEWGLRWDG
ncbi:hypothetical protein BJX62DRAFT_109576 [Aspergillus germanicus]